MVSELLFLGKPVPKHFTRLQVSLINACLYEFTDLSCDMCEKGYSRYTDLSHWMLVCVDGERLCSGFLGLFEHNRNYHEFFIQFYINTRFMCFVIPFPLNNSIMKSKFVLQNMNEKKNFLLGISRAGYFQSRALVV